MRGFWTIRLRSSRRRILWIRRVYARRLRCEFLPLLPLHRSSFKNHNQLLTTILVSVIQHNEAHPHPPPTTAQRTTGTPSAPTADPCLRMLGRICTPRHACTTSLAPKSWRIVWAKRDGRGIVFEAVEVDGEWRFCSLIMFSWHGDGFAWRLNFDEELHIESTGSTVALCRGVPYWMHDGATDSTHVLFPGHVSRLPPD